MMQPLKRQQNNYIRNVRLLVNISIEANSLDPEHEQSDLERLQKYFNRRQ